MNFPKTYVIQMPGSKRNPGLYDSLNSLKIDYQIQEAVVGKNLTEQEILEYVNLKSCDARLGYRISKELIGCGLSHKLIYTDALKKNYDWILVFEEDVQLINFNMHEIEEVTTASNLQPTVIQLFSRSSRIMKVNTIKHIAQSKRIIFDFEPRLIGFGASAYLINKPALVYAVQSELLDGPPDWPAWSSQIKFQGVYPWMVAETAVETTIPDNQIKKISYTKRRLLQITGLHYLRYRAEYSGIKDYLKVEIIPYLIYINWRITGSNYYLNDPGGPQITIRTKVKLCNQKK